MGLPGAKLRDDLIGVDGPLVRPLFVGFQKPEDPSRTGWYYMGKYEFSIPSLNPQAKPEKDADVPEADQQQGQQRFLAPVEWESLTEIVSRIPMNCDTRAELISAGSSEANTPEWPHLATIYLLVNSPTIMQRVEKGVLSAWRNALGSIMRCTSD